MIRSMSNDDSDEEVFVRFLSDLEGTADQADIIRRYSVDHPELAEQFRAMVTTRKMIAMSAAPQSHDDVPMRLGDFQIRRELATGGMGVVYEAEQRPFGRRVAVKTIRRGRHPIDPTYRARFLREQEVLARLHHTHIVPIHAAGQEGEIQFYAMPYIQGVTLSRVIQSLRSHGSIRPGEETPALADLADSLCTEADSERDAESEPVASTMPRAPQQYTPDSAEAPSSPATPARLSPMYLRSVARVIASAAEAIQHAHESGIIHRDLKPSNLMVDKSEHCWVVDFGLAGLRRGQ